MTVATNNAPIISANAFINNTNDMYMVFAKNTPWTNDDTPDTESSQTTTLDNELYYAKINQRLLVYPTTNSDNTIMYGGNNYAVASNLTNAISNNAHYVLLSATIPTNTTGVSDFTFRQIGIKTGVTASDSSNVINANLVTNTGILLFYSNQKPQSYLASSTNLSVKYLVDFTTLIK